LRPETFFTCRALTRYTGNPRDSTNRSIIKATNQELSATTVI
jgi:hypothetical protein